MAKKSVFNAAVLDILHVTISAEATEPAVICFSMDGDTDLQLRLTPESLAKLEGLLAAASVEQAKHNPVQ